MSHLTPNRCANPVCDDQINDCFTIHGYNGFNCGCHCSIALLFGCPPNTYACMCLCVCVRAQRLHEKPMIVVSTLSPFHALKRIGRRARFLVTLNLFHCVRITILVFLPSPSSSASSSSTTWSTLGEAKHISSNSFVFRPLPVSPRELKFLPKHVIRCTRHDKTS